MGHLFEQPILARRRFSHCYSVDFRVFSIIIANRMFLRVEFPAERRDVHLQVPYSRFKGGQSLIEIVMLRRRWSDL
jgi:hypothetical protein